MRGGGRINGLAAGLSVAYLAVPALFLVFLLLAGFTALLERGRFRRAQSLTLEQKYAVVLSKRTLPGMRHHFSGTRAYALSLVSRQAVFLLENREQRGFFLTRAQYDAVRIGLRGVLTWRGDVFLDFSVEQPDKI